MWGWNIKQQELPGCPHLLFSEAFEHQCSGASEKIADHENRVGIFIIILSSFCFFFNLHFVWSFKAANQSNCGEVINPWTHLFTAFRDAHQQFFHSILSSEIYRQFVQLVPQLSKGICHFLIELLFYLEFRTLFKSCFFKVEKCIKIQTRKLHVYFYYSLKVNEVEVKKLHLTLEGTDGNSPFYIATLLT